MTNHDLAYWTSDFQEYQLIFLAAGKGERFKADENKVLKPVLDDGRPVFDYSLRHYLVDGRCQKIILAHNPKDKEKIQSFLKENYPKHLLDKIHWVSGGDHRQTSVYQALDQVTSTYVLIQEAARPLITRTAINRLLESLMEKGKRAASLALPVVDTIHQKEGNLSIKLMDRGQMAAIQTPQGFLTSLLKEAMDQSQKNNHVYNEEGGAVLALGKEVYLVFGQGRNMKLTRAEDLTLIRTFLTIDKNKTNQNL